MFFIGYCFLVLSILLVSSSAAPYELCSNISMKGDISTVLFSTCPDEADICVFYPNTKVTAELDFVSWKNLTELYMEAYGMLFDKIVKLPTDEVDACEAGVPCPLMAGEDVSFVHDIEIKDYYPRLSFKIRYMLVDEDDDVIVCLEVPIKIEDVYDDTMY